MLCCIYIHYLFIHLINTASEVLVGCAIFRVHVFVFFKQSGDVLFAADLFLCLCRLQCSCYHAAWLWNYKELFLAIVSYFMHTVKVEKQHHLLHKNNEVYCSLSHRTLVLNICGRRAGNRTAERRGRFSGALGLNRFWADAQTDKFKCSTAGQ